MFNKICNENKVPNSYIYTSHTGSEYIFLEGMWINCQTMVEVHRSKNHKMEESALRQIAEHNQNSTLKIGKQYTLNESHYTFVGNGKVTLNGNLLSESMGNNIIPLMEAAESVPNGYVYTSDKGKSYYKLNGNWFSSETKKPINSSASQGLERAAARKVQAHNESNAVKIGQEWTSKKGKTYKYAGDDRWISDDGRMLPANIAKSVTSKFNAKDNDEKVSPEDEKIDSAEQKDDSEPKGDEKPVEAPVEAPKEEPKAPDAPESTPEDKELASLAEKIKAHPERRRLTILLTRGDVTSLLAADIILSGSQKEATAFLKSLNNEEN